MTHDPALSLRAGGDRLLCLIARLAGAGGALSFAASDAPGWWLVAGASACAVAGLRFGRRRTPFDDATLRVRADGKAELLAEGREPVNGFLFERAWITPKYAVIRCKMHSRNLSLLISRSRQQRGEFRALLAWLRLGFPERGAES